MRFRLAQFRNDVGVEKILGHLLFLRLPPSQSTAGRSDILEPRAGSQKQAFNIRRGIALQSPPLLNRNQNRFLNSAPGDYLGADSQRCIEKFAESSFGLLELPRIHLLLN
jgi:hypothetical protein